jgi:hypothetical protein
MLVERPSPLLQRRLHLFESCPRSAYSTLDLLRSATGHLAHPLLDLPGNIFGRTLHLVPVHACLRFCGNARERISAAAEARSNRPQVHRYHGTPTPIILEAQALESESGQIAYSQLAWVEGACDWVLNRRGRFDYTLQLPAAAIDPSEDAVSIEATNAMRALSAARVRHHPNTQ